MGAEYPPVIIDGSSCFTAGDDQLQTPAQASMRATTGSAPAARLDPAAIASLYLIRNNLLRHEGDFRLDEVELVSGDDGNTAGRTKDTSVRLSEAPVTDHGSGLCRVGAKDKVHSIRVSGRQDLLRYGQDFHNFLLILQPKR